MNPSNENELLAGTILGEKYSVVKRLGIGGMGAVYEATNTWTNRRVAVKVLLSAASKRPDLEQRFMQEAQAVARLRHPNIIDVLDMGRDRGTGALFIVQELLNGIDLFDYMHGREPMTVRETMEIMVPVMGAMIAAHDRGILHRDLKPENIFLQKGKGSERIPKVIDFGVAKVLSGANASRQTGSGQVIGTVQYMSPEQARAERNLDARCDVWALGVVIYEMLTGELPYEAPNAKALIARLTTVGPRRISELAPELPPQVCALVHKALAVKASERFQSVREMLDATLALDMFADDPPEQSLVTRHLRSLPTYTAQLKPSPNAVAAAVMPVIPRAPKVATVEAVSFSGVDHLVDDAVASLGLNPLSSPSPKAAPTAAAVVATPVTASAPEPEIALPPVAVEPAAPVAVVSVSSARRNQSTDVVPVTYPARKPTRWAGKHSTIGPKTTTLMKAAALAFVLASLFSVVMGWRSLKMINGEHARLRGVIAQVERSLPSARSPAPPHTP